MASGQLDEKEPAPMSGIRPMGVVGAVLPVSFSLGGHLMKVGCHPSRKYCIEVLMVLGRRLEGHP